jgi:methylglutaconyl-CoA hydratase
MSEQPVICEKRQQVYWLTINRPERRNAINPDVISGLATGIAVAADDPSVRCLVLTGAGNKAFCAGADLSRGPGVFADAAAEPTTDFGRLSRRVRDLRKPMLGRVNGDCVAGGIGLLALCDIVVASSHARFGLPEVRVGVFPMQVLVYLRKTMLPRHFNELSMLGELIDAEKAKEFGLLNYVVSDQELDAKIAHLVTRITEASPAAMMRGKLAIAALEDMPFHQAIAFAEAQIALMVMSDDVREGLAAFNEKRKPRWGAAEPRDKTGMKE